MKNKKDKLLLYIHYVGGLKPNLFLFGFYFLTEKMQTSVGKKKKLSLVGFVEIWHICGSGSLAVTFCHSKVERLN